MKSHVVDLGGPVHFVDFGGTGRQMVLVHGLGGSALNWLAVGEDLAKRARVRAVDLVGFGRTPPAGRATTVAANHGLLDRFLDTVVGEPAILVGNSMGGLITMMEAASSPARVSALVLAAPAQPTPRGAGIDRRVLAAFALYAVPWVAPWYLRQRSRRLGAEGLVREMLSLCCVDPTRVPAPVRQAHVELALERIEQMPWANSSLLEAARSILAVIRRPRAYAAMVAKITAPTLLIQGTRDRLVPLAATERLARVRADWRLDVFAEVGHIPQLEAPERFTDSVTRWLATTSSS